MGPDDKICYCYGVPLRKLWSFAQRHRLQRASQLSECLGAGTGCGWCIPILKRLFEHSQQHAAPGISADTVPQADLADMTPQQYAKKRQEYIQTKQPRNQF